MKPVIGGERPAQAVFDVVNLQEVSGNGSNASAVGCQLDVIGGDGKGGLHLAVVQDETPTAAGVGEHGTRRSVGCDADSFDRARHGQNLLPLLFAVASAVRG